MASLLLLAQQRLAGATATAAVGDCPCYSADFGAFYILKFALGILHFSALARHGASD
jgi:hypothetical protein